MGEVKLKPCPFCGAEDVRLFYLEFSEEYSVTCDVCNAWGARAENREEAAELWNQRADEPVRCKDCVSYVGVNVPKGRGLCKILGKMCGDSDFCSMGRSAKVKQSDGRSDN